MSRPIPPVDAPSVNSVTRLTARGVPSSLGAPPALPTVATPLELARGNCTLLQRAFCEDYAQNRNARAAYLRAGYSDASPAYLNQNAHRLLSSQTVSRYVLELEREASSHVDMREVVRQIIASDMRIVAAAASDLSNVVHDACRHCHGINGKYQWRDLVEYTTELQRVLDVNAMYGELRSLRRKAPVDIELPTDDGGYGYRITLAVNPECPKCDGIGVRRTQLADTRHLEGSAAALYAGVKETNAGIEILTHDVGKAKERLLRIAGAFGDDAASVARAAAGGAAIGAVTASKVMETMSAEEAQRLYQSLA